MTNNLGTRLSAVRHAVWHRFCPRQSVCDMLWFLCAALLSLLTACQQQPSVTLHGTYYLVVTIEQIQHIHVPSADYTFFFDSSSNRCGKTEFKTIGEAVLRLERPCTYEIRDQSLTITFPRTNYPWATKLFNAERGETRHCLKRRKVLFARG